MSSPGPADPDILRRICFCTLGALRPDRGWPVTGSARVHTTHGTEWTGRVVGAGAARPQERTPLRVYSNGGRK